ncbi:MAG: SUMF1/EgtB/PvdO family nonheme iron enzyme, partial [Thiogranum sp.]
MSILVLCGILLAHSASYAIRDRETGPQDQQIPLRVISAPLLFELVWIPPGRFRMGDIAGSGQADERPLREVEINGFWMMRTEVTRGMFARFVEDTRHATGDRCWVHEGGWSEREGLNWKAPGFGQSDDHPVTCVNWHDAQAFITWLNHKSGEAFRLPSEAEWEYAARAGSESVYYMGEEPSELCAHANAADKRALEHYPGFAVNDCDDGYVRTSPVASFAASPWGLYDIYG